MGVTGRHGRAEGETVMDQKKRNQLSRRGLLAGAGALAIVGGGVGGTGGAGGGPPGPRAGGPPPPGGWGGAGRGRGLRGAEPGGCATIPVSGRAPPSTRGR